MTISYSYLPREDKKLIDSIAEWVQKNSGAEVLGNSELLKKRPSDFGYISKDNIYQDYHNIRDDIEEGCPDELFFALMEKLTGSRFKGFIDKYKRDPDSRLKYKPAKEWFDMEMLLDMDLEAKGGVSIENISSFIGESKEFDHKLTKLPKPRFAAIGRVYKKKYAIDEDREVRKKRQIVKDKTFIDRYDLYLFNIIAAKFTAKAIDARVHIDSIDGFVLEQEKMIREYFSYKTPIGNDRLLKRIIPRMVKEIRIIYAAFAKEGARAVVRLEPALSSEEIYNALADYIEEQNRIYSKGNSILNELDKAFTQKAVHFKTLEKEHLRYHSIKPLLKLV